MHSIEHDSQSRCFKMPVEGLDCILEYTLNGSVMTITHTEVPEELGGRGLAGIITKHALEFAKDMKWQVVPECSYAAAYITRHPEYSNLLHTP